jgi:endonuclease/exonuclease/phosphatase family metal-dependent hydrolase
VGGARGFGYRLDHIVVSPQIEIEACDYLHEWRELGGSDHSAMWARLRLPGAANSR